SGQENDQAASRDDRHRHQHRHDGLDPEQHALVDRPARLGILRGQVKMNVGVDGQSRGGHEPRGPQRPLAYLVPTGPGDCSCHWLAFPVVWFTLMVSRVLVGVVTWRLAMSDGSQEALAGMLSGPASQTSQAPLTSVRPPWERMTRRHCTYSGTPRICNWMLVPHDVAVRVAIALTCVAGSMP